MGSGLRTGRRPDADDSQRKDTKHFDPADAVRVKRNDRLKIVKIAPVTTRGQDTAAAAASTGAAVKETP